MANLTADAVTRLYKTDPLLTSQQIQPVLQVISSKIVAPNPEAGPDGKDRYRLVLSDGKYYMPGMLATQVNHLFENGSFGKHSVIKINNFHLSQIQGKRVLIITSLQPSAGIVTSKIGTPRSIDSIQGGNNNPYSSSLASANPSARGNFAPPPTIPSSASRGGIMSQRGGGAFGEAVGRGGGGVNAARGGFGGAVWRGRGEGGGGPPNAVGMRGGQRGARGGGTFGSGGRGGGGAGRGGGGEGFKGGVFPIEALSPYQNKWTIRARVTQKSEIKTWSNAKGEGRLFSMTLMDESSRIKVTAFNEEVDNFFDVVEEGKAYYFTGGKVGLARKQFSNLSNDFEITLERSSEIELVEDDNSVPKVQYNFVPLSQLEEMEKDTTVDAIGILISVGELGSITSKKTNAPVMKREITIIDRSEYACQVSLWGKSAENFAVEQHSVIAFKDVRVGDFKGKTLSVSIASSLSINPDFVEAHALRGWFDSLPLTNHSWKAYTSTMPPGSSNVQLTLSEAVNDLRLGTHDKTDYFSFKGTIGFIKSDRLSYPACPTDGCQKKVIEDGGTWRCEKCDKEVSAPNYRYLLTFTALDHTGYIWLTAFNDFGTKLFGMQAGEMEQIQYENPEAVKAICAKICGKTFNFRSSARSDTFQDNETIKYSIQNGRELAWKVEAQQLIGKIKEYGVIQF